MTTIWPLSGSSAVSIVNVYSFAFIEKTLTRSMAGVDRFFAVEKLQHFLSLSLSVLVLQLRQNHISLLICEVKHIASNVYIRQC